MLEQINIKEKVKAKLKILTMNAPEQKLGTGGPQGYTTAMVGQAYPYVLLNSEEIPQPMLGRVELDCMGFMPKLFMTINLSGGKSNFFKQIFPRAGDIISIFLRSPNDNIKPIRNDYQIVTVDYFGGDYPGDIGVSVLRITARLYIPNFYTEKIFSLEGTSYEVLKKIAEELEIGFASNVDSTNDKMRWRLIGNYERFINSITDHAWEDENSFFTAFIDFYYNLNLINVNKQFTYAPDGQPGVISDINVRIPKENKTFESNMEVFALTNDVTTMSFNNFIRKFDIINNASLITYNQGVYKDYALYDFSSRTVVGDAVGPLSTPDAPQTVTPLFWNAFTGTIASLVWLGTQYSLPIGNVHRNYMVAKMLNSFNLMEIEKIMLEASLANPNLFVHRGQRVPVIIMNYGDATDRFTVTDPKYETGTRTVSTANSFLSDFYYVKGHKLIYDQTEQLGFSQVIYLSKREWTTSSVRQ